MIFFMSVLPLFVLFLFVHFLALRCYAVKWNGVATVFVVDSASPINRNFFINNYCLYILFGFN